MSKFVEFLVTMLQVGSIGFGGGSALIPVMEEKFVEEQRLESKANFDRDVIVASITPGALPVEIAGSLGRRNFGYKGLILGASMMAMPGALLALLMFTLLSTVQSGLLTLIKVASVGITAFIIYLLVHYIRNVLLECRLESKARLWKCILVISGVCVLACGNNLYKLLGIDRTPVFAVSTICVLLAAFFAVFYTRSDYSKWHIFVTGVLCTIYMLGHGKAGIVENGPLLYGVQILMVVLAVWGGFQSFRKTKWDYTMDKKKMGQDLVSCLVFFLVVAIPAVMIDWTAVTFLLKGLLSALMSFGGGDAYLTIADGLFVESGMISADTYYGNVVSVVNILPGSILCKTLLGVGYYIGLEAGGSVLGGVVFAAAGFACSISASCAAFSMIYYAYDSLTNSKVFKVIGRWIRSIIAGLLVNVMLSLCIQNRVAAEYIGKPFWMLMLCTAVLAVGDFLIARTGKVKSVWILVLNLLVVFIIF